MTAVNVTNTKVIGTREDLASLFSLERRFIDTWIASGSGDIPQLPHLPDLGSGTRFHLPTVEAWLLKHFQRGGEATSKPAKRSANSPRS